MLTSIKNWDGAIGALIFLLAVFIMRNWSQIRRHQREKQETKAENNRIDS